MLLKKAKLEMDDKLKAKLSDRIVNPYSEFPNVFKKRCKYNDDVLAGVYAFDEKSNKILLGNSGAKFNDVEFIAGLWRIQNKFPYKVVNVRGQDFVLLEKLDHKEKTKFDFYSAVSVGTNCYGYFISDTPDYYVAKYETEMGVFMAYGQTKEQARAFLGIKLYDQYQDLIHGVLNGKNK